MCHLDGTICKTQKSAIVPMFENLIGDCIAPENFYIAVVDGFFLLHCLRDVPKTFGNLSKKILSTLKAMHASRVDIIFDQYFSPSIKDYERALRNEDENINFTITRPDKLRPVNFIN